ncbi:hypothetical protein HYPSUDRAFT_48879 [Hypholoma sublateritium FD-334 SS-4]|uniref:Ketoreductase (KR) domain-containing protein n=1 Tax=Hypholoma sublateritium (strain FD-334 SS-4) TaxID=945553 RepID=A0A0D2N6M5_HYPSF|nr:hypothetical protein HYPSUDRAFT_48879 [Hypholoma sublateritium FD-334 SS-4]
MPSFAAAREANATFNPEYVPVIVVTGGTAGIGQAMVEALAHHLKGRLHVVIVGRNRAAGEKVIAGLPSAPESKYEVMVCDVTIMKSIHALTAELLARLPKINFLVHSAGFVRFRGGRQETEDGIDDMMAIRYYNRFALTKDLLPLLQIAAAKGEATNVLSVLSAGQLPPKVDLEDLGLKKTYTFMKAATQTGAYNDLMIAEFARQNPEIAFSHIYPGFVFNGTMFGPGKMTTFLSIFFGPLIWGFTIPPKHNAEYMLFGMLSAKKGLNRFGKYGDAIGMKSFPQTKDGQKLLWEHSMEVTKSS